MQFRSQKNAHNIKILPVVNAFRVDRISFCILCIVLVCLLATPQIAYGYNSITLFPYTEIFQCMSGKCCEGKCPKTMNENENQMNGAERWKWNDRVLTLGTKTATQQLRRRRLLLLLLCKNTLKGTFRKFCLINIYAWRLYQYVLHMLSFRLCASLKCKISICESISINWLKINSRAISCAIANAFWFSFLQPLENHIGCVCVWMSVYIFCVPYLGKPAQLHFLQWTRCDERWSTF